MGKHVTITKKAIRNMGGSYVVSFEGVLTDELDRKRALSGSVAVSDPDVAMSAIEVEVRRKLGYRGFTISEAGPVAPKRPTLSARG